MAGLGAVDSCGSGIYLTGMVPPRKPAEPAKPSKHVAWNIVRLTGSPAKQIGRVYAPDETTAIAKAIDEFGIPEAHWRKLAARRSS
jgi:hypothetical protein